MSEVKSNRAWRLECEFEREKCKLMEADIYKLRAERDRLAALLLEARGLVDECGNFGLVDSIDYALAEREKK